MFGSLNGRDSARTFSSFDGAKKPYRELQYKTDESLLILGDMRGHPTIPIARGGASLTFKNVGGGQRKVASLAMRTIENLEVS